MNNDSDMRSTQRAIPKKYANDVTPYQFPEGALMDGRLTINAIRTVTAGLLITPVIFKGDARDGRIGTRKYTLTHAATGAAVLPSGQGISIRVARYVAGVLGAIGMDWTEQDRDTAVKQGAAKLVEFKLMDWLRREVAA